MTFRGFVYFVPFAAFVLQAACSSSGSPAVRAVMRTPIAPASDALFNAVVYTNGQLASAPQTDAQWTRLRDHARSLADAGGTLRGLAPPAVIVIVVLVEHGGSGGRTAAPIATQVLQQYLARGPQATAATTAAVQP